MPAETDIDKLNELCERIGYYYKDNSILIKALTHSSYSYETTQNLAGSNEILEFLGDAVVNLSVARYLIDRFPEKDEGDLSRMRAELVNERTLARVAEIIGLEKRLLIGKSARLEGEDIPRSLLADGVEALVGAAFQDGGYAVASALVMRLLASFLDDTSFETGTDYKTRLQEFSQKFHKILPEYRMEATTGPEHQRVFVSSVWINAKKMGEGKGKSIKASEQQAARRAFEELKRAGAIEQKGQK
jgi:ribonuclease-3